MSALTYNCTTIMTSRRLFRHNPVPRGTNKPIRKSELFVQCVKFDSQTHHSIVNRENGYETRQSSLLYVTVLFFVLDPAQNTIVGYSELRNQPIETCWLRNSCIMYARKTKGCAGLWTFQHKSCHLCLFL